MKNFLPFVLLLFVSTISLANNNPEFEIKLNFGKFIPDVTTDFRKAIEPLKGELDQGHIYRLIQFYTIPTSAEKRIIHEAGVELLSYIPNKAFISKIHSSVSTSELEKLNIRSILFMVDDFKLSTQLTNGKLPDWAMLGDDIQLKVKYYSKEDESMLDDFITENDGKIMGRLEEVNVVYIKYPADKLSALAENPLIQWIEPISPQGTPDDTKGKNSTRSNTLNTNYSAGRKYDGSGIVVALSDDGLIGPHIDFQGRVTLQTDVNSGNHGDMTSGIFVGAGNLDPLAGGIVPGADIHIYKQGTTIFLSSYPHIVNGVNNLNTHGTVITSTSYSQGQGGIYTADTEFTDQQINENQNIIHVLSAGNSGTFDHGYGAGAGWANISGGIKAGKNVICAGNVTESDELFLTSSRGPAADGRIKPDLCAQGQDQLSTNENNTYQIGAGTSASTPTIAGVLAQLYQAYKELNGGQKPETGLLKAALMNTAEDLGNPGPDFKHGWGRINGLKAVRVIEEQRYIRDSIEQNENNSHIVTVPANVSEVRIMVYWMDVEGNPASAVALVNDINMQVVAPGANIHNPWVLDPTPNAASLNAAATQGIDNLNNAEQVTIGNPEPGDYTVNLSGFAIPDGPQRYYVIYEFVYNGVELTYPIGGEDVVPLGTQAVTWDASESTDNFTLEYSTDGGNNYTIISTNISANKRSYNWTAPNILSNEVKIRVSRGGASSESFENFTIAGVPQSLTILSVCPDTIEIGWNNVSGVSLYEISMLGEKYMDSIGVTSSNTFKIGGLNPNDEHWFSVRSIVSGSKGRRAIAVKQSSGTLNCELDNDVALVQLLYPFEGIISTCRDLENTDVIINVTNHGLQTATDVELNYQINNGAIVTEALPGTLEAGATTKFTFSTQTDMSALGSYDISIWASWAADENFFNDTIQTVTEVLSSDLVSTFPHFESFQSFTNCSTSPTCEAVICPLANGWFNINNPDFDDIDWRTDSGGTSTTNTGPTADFDDGTANGKYLYLEGTEGCNFREAILFSPCVDLTTAGCASFEFAYHMYGANIGELHVDVLTKNGEFVDVVNPIIGNQGNQWTLLDIDLSPFVGEIINIRIRGSIGNGTRADAAIDAMSFETTEMPVADFNFSIGATVETILFSNNSTGDITSYLWDFGDGNISSDPNPEHEYQDLGTYDVSLIVAGDCGADTIIQTVTVSPTFISNSEELTSKIKIYPNPTSSKFTIQLPVQIPSQGLSIKLKDVVGREILDIDSARNHELSIDVSEIPSGLFFIEISCENFKIARKIVVQ